MTLLNTLIYAGETPYNQCSNDRLDFIECRKIKTKLITTANQRKRKQTQSKHKANYSKSEEKASFSFTSDWSRERCEFS